MDPARPRVGTPIRNGCRSVTDCHKRREVYKGAPSLLRVPASEHAASSSSAPWFPRNARKLKSRAQRLYSLDGISGKTSSGTSYSYVLPGVPSNLGRSLYGEASTIH